MTADAHDDPAATLADLSARIGRWLPAARWFPGKDRGEGSVRVIDLVALPGPGSIAVALVAAADTVLVVPVAVPSGADAGHEPGFAGPFTRLALGGGELEGCHGRLVGHPVAPTADPALPPGVASAEVRARPLGADASNTSLVVDGADAADAVVLKVFRQARPGIHPEVEFGRFFAVATDWRETPRLRGWVEYLPAEAAGPGAAVATLHSFKPGCRSAWEVLVGWLADGGLDGGHRGPILDLARSLGAVTARMHRALASRRDLPDFAPAPASAAGRRALGERLAAHARAVLPTASGAARGSPFAARLARLAAEAPALAATLRSVADAGTGAADIRVHGDYHLGQVLVAADGARVMPIDFEGEPTRSLEERRGKTSAAKDVAGMLRSFDYSLAIAARIPGAGRGDPGPLATAFLEAYRHDAAGASWWPSDAGEERALLTAFTLDKAIYELAYELANRPDWVEVPLAALEAIAFPR